MIPVIVPAITSKMAKGTGGPSGDECQNLIVAPPLTLNPYGDHESREGLLVAHTLRAEADASEDGTGRGTPIVPVAFQPRIARNGRGNMGDIVNALQAQSGRTGKGDTAPCVVYDMTHADDPMRKCGDVAPTLQQRMGTGGNQVPLFSTRLMVRRLTPRECERLQGFPDDWTRWGEDGRKISDSARYRMLGNAMCVNVAEWIGKRIVKWCGV